MRLINGETPQECPALAQRKSMEEVITSTTFQRDFRRIVQKVHAGDTNYVVTISGLPVMAVIPMDEYKEFMKEREKHEQEEREREERVKRFERLARRIGEAVEKSGMTEAELMAELEKDKAAIYEKYYGDTNKT
jgi:prevent-host-death family protein